LNVIQGTYRLINLLKSIWLEKINLLMIWFYARSDLWIFFGDDVNEFIIVDNSVSVFISIIDHLINFSNWEILSNAGSNLFKFFWTKSTLLFNIEIFKELSQWWFTVSLSTESEDFEESCEVHLFSMWWGVDNTDDLLGLVFNTKSSNGVDQFISWDVSTSIIIEDIEAFFKLDDSFFWEVFVGVFFGVESLR
jgi:hypothetical protein